ncbi:hypothetical protein [Gloeobacter kilaueensis]
MSRLTIEVTEQQHQSIKAMAALQGLSIKEYVLARLLDEPDNTAKLQQLREKIALASASIAAGKGLAYSNGETLAQDVIARGEQRLNRDS